MLYLYNRCVLTFLFTDNRMTMDNKAQLPKGGGNNNTTPQECAGCGKLITER